MSSEEVELWLSKINDKRRVTEVRRFLQNLFILFDGRPPEHIAEYIKEILTLLTHADRVSAGVESMSSPALKTRS